jgi:hypothetical protein
MNGALHALMGAALGKLSRHTGKAIAAGIASHVVTDLVPHKDYTIRGEAPLLVATLGLLAWKFGVKSPEFIGACAAAAPDVENVAAMMNLVPRKYLVSPTHRVEGFHAPDTDTRWHQGAIAVACLAYLFWKQNDKRKN